MSLTVVIGPMFSGKSSYLISSIKKYQEINWPVYTITSSFDKRYSTDPKIMNHNKEGYKVNKSVLSLFEVASDKEYLESKVVIIDEGQFYQDLVEFVLESIEIYEKHVIVAGLDGDAMRKPFGKILNIIPYADNIVKLKAYCKKCSNGTEALFTSKKIQGTKVVDIGGADKYEAVCRKHYIAFN